MLLSNYSLALNKFDLLFQAGDCWKVAYGDSYDVTYVGIF